MEAVWEDGGEWKEQLHGFFLSFFNITCHFTHN